MVRKEPKFLNPGFEINEGPKTIVPFWRCSLQTTEETIDFTDQAGLRAADLLTLVWIFWTLSRVEGKKRRHYEEVIEQAENASSGLYRTLHQIFESTYLTHDSIGGRIKKAANKDPHDPDENWKEIEPRVKWLWNIIAE